MGDNNSIPIPEYKPVTHHCSCCSKEIDDEEELFEVDDEYLCEDCFVQFITVNYDAFDFAKAFGYNFMKAGET